MVLEDKKHISFRTPIDIFCYTVMPYSLKNVSTMYQWAMKHIFDEVIHLKVEYYIDDLIVEGMDQIDHLSDLRIIFERIKNFDIKVNPLKCTFNVSYDKFLGYII